MNNTYSTSLLASFATIKGLSDDNKYQSPYQILAEFIRHIIVNESLYAFSAAEMKVKLNQRFEFSIPEAVIRTSARKMNGVTLFNGVYTVSKEEIGTDSLFIEKRKEADDIKTNIMNLLVDYVREKTGDYVSLEILTKNLIAFLVDDQQDSQGQYTELISEFVLKNENNEKIQNGLNRIKQGSILYIGLNYNINETGSLTKELTLYLGTEILFSLVGYNGEIFKQLADDFYNQVRVANSSGQKRIILRYFSDVKKEVDEYFYAAQEIVEGRITSFLNKPAMISITKGCSKASDVQIKQADFYHKLQLEFGVTEDPKKDYYDESQYKNNLESMEYLEDDEGRKKELGIKYVSHINKLRNGMHYTNDIESEHLLVTNTKATLSISKEQSERIKSEKGLETVSNFAVSLDRITNLLWYKLGNGFGNKKYPASVSAVLNARIVLSSSVAKKADRAFSDTKKQYDDGIITKDQLAARIITLRNKPVLPEHLQGEDIDDIMDFSPEFLSRYEEQVNSDREALKEKDRIIEALHAEKNAAIALQESTIKDKERENSKLQAELEKYHQKDAEEQQRKEKRKRIYRFVWSILWKIAIVAVVGMTSVWICKRVSPTHATAIGIAVSALSLIPAVIIVCKKDFNNCFRKDKS